VTFWRAGSLTETTMMTYGHPLKTTPTPGPSILAAADVLTQAAQAILRTGDASRELMVALNPFRPAAPPDAKESR
jgi:hypothetical protein